MHRAKLMELTRSTGSRSWTTLQSVNMGYSFPAMTASNFWKMKLVGILMILKMSRLTRLFCRRWRFNSTAKIRTILALLQTAQVIEELKHTRSRARNVKLGLSKPLILILMILLMQTKHSKVIIVEILLPQYLITANLGASKPRVLAKRNAHWKQNSKIYLNWVKL